MPENAANIRVLQGFFRHADVKTTEMYTHVMRKNLNSLQGPLGRLYKQ